MRADIVFEWDYLESLVAIRGWHIYLTEDAAIKGTRVGCCIAPEPKKTLVSLEEGSWTLRAIPVGGDDQEAADWRECPARTFLAHGRDQTPATPVLAGVAFVEPGSSIRVAINPVSLETVPGTVEVIALPHGSHAAMGKLLGSFRVERGDLIDRDPTRIVSPPIPYEGTGSGSNATVAVRVVSDTGQPGPHSLVTFAKPDRPDSHAITVASISRAAGTDVNFPSSAASKGYEFGAGYGMRLKTLPQFDSLHTQLFASVERIAPFVTNATIVTAEVDLGGERTFVLEISDEIERATQKGAFDTEVLRAFGAAGSFSPTDDPTTRRSAEDPAWTGREVFMDGTPRRPIRPENARWCYVVGLITGVETLAATPSNWVEYVPGAVVRGRYICLVLVLREPLGLHQLVTGDVSAVARIMRKTTVGTGSPESVVLGVPGDRYVDDSGPPHLYGKATGIGTTGWVTDG